MITKIRETVMNIKINGLSVYLAGKKENKAIVFIHGFPFDHQMWDAQVEEFKKNQYCITYDIRGLGNSPESDGQYTMESFVDDLESIVDELNLIKPALCGLSMGGYISLRAIERMENKFSSLILCDTKSMADDDEGKIKRAAGVKLINNDGVEKFVEQFVPNLFASSFINEHKSEYEKALNRSKNNSATGVKGCLLAMAGRTDTTSYLSRISIPTLLICGKEDKLTPPDVMKSMAEKIKHSKFAVIEGAGHMTPIEASAIVNEKFSEFLRK